MTLYIIAITFIISLSAFSNPQLMDRLILDPYMMKHHNQWYRYITSGFIHADMVHLIVNMYTLYLFGDAVFGQSVEFFYGAVFGKSAQLVFVLLYVTSIFAANVSTYMKYKDSRGYRSLGASGATSAIVFTLILFAPKANMIFDIVPAYIVGIAYLAYSYTSSKKANDNINHEAHLYGAIYGVLFTLCLKPEVGKMLYHQFF